ncbi:phosphonoacetaldehyde reductase [Aquisalimonas sp.]|uniref:phosphonoacetaldehyde reductase n=1 Tax=Aquisalimonas sp. TaxID=1872621 RepID=UPI0025C62503|nr:phosphonoacetaldehyde reductase [Aquisalimonas sp.]
MNSTKPFSPFTLEKSWGFHNPVKVSFGRGVRQNLAQEFAGKTCLIVTTQRGRRQLTDDYLLGAFAADEEHIWVDTVTENPGLLALETTVEALRNQRFDAIVAFGGGSSIDSAKVLAIALSSQCAGRALRDLLAHPELHHGAQTRPLYAVPTTAGTGSEVTPFATVWDHEKRKKHSLAGPAVFPYAAYVDPALTDTAPEAITLSTGLDAINQAAESIWNNNATPITLELATRALQLGFGVLPGLVAGEDGGLRARDQMAECSLLAGLAISQTRTALCHSMSYPITAHFGVPHGLACAYTMPAVLEHNLAADDGRFINLAARMANGNEAHESLMARFSELNDRLGVAARIRQYVSAADDLQALTADMVTPGRVDNNLAPVTPHDIRRVLRRASASSLQ